MATHSRILDWRIPWTEDLVGCSLCGHKVRSNLARIHNSFSITILWNNVLHLGECQSEDSYYTMSWTETGGGWGTLFFFFERDGCLFFCDRGAKFQGELKEVRVRDNGKQGIVVLDNKSTTHLQSFKLGFLEKRPQREHIMTNCTSENWPVHSCEPTEHTHSFIRGDAPIVFSDEFKLF